MKEHPSNTVHMTTQAISIVTICYQLDFLGDFAYDATFQYFQGEVISSAQSGIETEFTFMKQI